MSDHPHASPWVAAMATGILVLLLSAAGLLVVRTGIANGISKQAMQSREATDALSTRIAKLEALPAADPTGKAAIDAATQPLNDRIVALEAQLTAAEVRIETLEKTPVPVAPAAVIAPAPAPAVVLPQANTAPEANPTAPTPAIMPPPIPSDAQLMDELHQLLDTLPRDVAPGNSTVEKINDRLKGLVSIRKEGSDPYLTVRNTKDVDSAHHAVEALPAEQQKPFAHWLELVKERDQNLAAPKAPEATSPKKE